MKKNKHLFIFDLDGTLVNAYEAIMDSLNFVRKQLDYSDVSLSVVKRSIGQGDILFIKHFFKPKDVEQALSLYRKHHKLALKHSISLMPFAGYLLKQLKKNHKLVAVVSNRPTQFTNIILNHLKIKKYIDFCLCSDKAKRIKPYPEMLLRTLEKFNSPVSSAVYIGDMAIDLVAAKRAHMEGIFVKGGSGILKEAKTYKGVKIVSSLREVLNIYE